MHPARRAGTPDLRGSRSAGQKISMLTNGVLTPLVTNWNGLKFYSPNDVAVKSDGTIWFTDPGYNSGITRHAPDTRLTIAFINFTPPTPMHVPARHQEWRHPPQWPLLLAG